MPTYDLLQPIKGDNRDEYFLVEYEGFIRNMAEGLIIAMNLIPGIYDEAYPELKNYMNKSPEELYNMTSPYGGEQMLYILSKKDIDTADLLREYSKIMEDKDVCPLQKETLFAGALSMLSEEKFVKEINIIKTTNYMPNDIEYIDSLFNGTGYEKVKMYTGSSIQFYIENPNITTYALNNPSIITSLVENKECEEHLKNTFFLLRDSIDTITMDPETELLKYANQDFYEELLSSKKCAVGHIETVMLNGNTSNEEIDNAPLG